MDGEIEVGAKVETADGVEVGRVKEVGGREFRVDAPRAFDYWLERDVVRLATPGCVTLLIAEAELAGYKKDRPNDPDAFSAPLPEELDPEMVEGQTLIDGNPRLRP